MFAYCCGNHKNPNIKGNIDCIFEIFKNRKETKLIILVHVFKELK